MKKYVIITLLSLLCLSVFVPWSEAAKYQHVSGYDHDYLNRPLLLVDGEVINNSLVEPLEIINRNNRYYIPLRAALEKLDISVVWNNRDQSIDLIKDGTTVNLKVNSSWAVVNGQKIPIDATPIMHRGLTYVPLRFISQTFGYEVIWHGETNDIAIFSQKILPYNDQQAKELEQKLKELFSIDLLDLPRNRAQIRKIYSSYVHPEYLDYFVEDVFDTINTPQSLPGYYHITTRLVAQSSDSAVLYYRVLTDDHGDTGYYSSLRGVKKHNGQWYMIW